MKRAITLFATAALLSALTTCGPVSAHQYAAAGYGRDYSNEPVPDTYGVYDNRYRPDSVQHPYTIYSHHHPSDRDDLPARHNDPGRTYGKVYQ